MKKITIRSHKGAFFFKYFSVFSAIVLVGLLLVGIAMTFFVSNFLTDENLDNTINNSRKVSAMMTELLESSTVTQNPEGAAFVILKSIDLVADCTGSDVFICNHNGDLIACGDMMTGFKLTQGGCEKHRGFALSNAAMQKAKKDGHSEFSTMDNFYNSVHSIAIEPFYNNEELSGYTVVSTPLSDNIISDLQMIIKMFLFAAALSLVLITIAVYVMTEKIAKPIRNLENATRCYASGDFSYRVPELNSRDELANLITKFNSMATSLSLLEDSRRSFVANVSHEFKTPMTTIRGFIDGILDGTIPPEKQSYYLEIVSSEINRLSRMVNMMLNISNIESGNVKMNLEQFNISDKILSTFLGFEQLFSNKSIEVMGFEDLPEANVVADSAMIDQVIYNLVDNAVKFTNDGGKIIVNAATDKNNVYFSVTNSGKGIPEKDLGKIFDRFYKVDESRSTDVKNTGLGLFLVKSIVDLHNGTVTVESQVDNFTRFTVRLPR